MDFYNHSTNHGNQKSSLADQEDRKSDFIVDMECFSHLNNKHLTLNSKISRSLSRKGSPRGVEKMMNPNCQNQAESLVVASFSPTALTAGEATQENAMVVTIGTGEQDGNKLDHDKITITANQTKLSGRRYSFRRSSKINPRAILIFLATLSSMGCLLLIYFTLAMGKFNDNEYDGALG